MAPAEPMSRNFKLLAQHELDGFGGMGEGMSMQIAKDGRRIIWLAHESAPKNFTAVDVSDPRKPKVVVQTDLPQAYMRSNSLEITGDIMAVAYQMPEGRARSRPASSCSTSRCRRSRSRSRSSTARARIRAACTSSGSATANTCTWPPARADFKPTQSARRPVLPHLRRAQSVEAGRGRPLVAAGHARGRQRAAAGAPRQPRSTRASAPTTPTSIRSGPTAAISAISTPACSSWTSPTSRSRSRSAAGTTRRPIPASPTRCCRCSSATCWSSPTNSTIDDAADWPKLDLDPRRARRDAIRCRSRPARCRRSTPSRSRGGRFGAHNIHENTPLPTAWHSDDDRHRHVLQRRLARLRHLQPVPAEGGRRPSCRRRPPLSPAARSSSTTCSSTSARSSTRSTASPAGSTSWRWISDAHDARLASVGAGRKACVSSARSGCAPALPATRRGRRGLDSSLGRRPFGRRQRERGARIPVTRRHRLPRRRQDHAGAALPGDAGRRRHRRHRQRVRRGRHRRRAAARRAPTRPCCSAMAACAASRAPTCRSRCAAWWPTASAARSRTSRRIVIETSGLADPGPILQTFATDRALGGEFSIEVVITVVDAATGSPRSTGRPRRASRSSSPTAS